MHRPVLKVRWAGPFVLALLLASAVADRAPAAPVASSAPAVAAVDEANCFKYAVAYVVALDEWASAMSAWNQLVNYNPWPIGDAAIRAAERVDEAAELVAQTGILLVLCLLV